MNRKTDAKPRRPRRPARQGGVATITISLPIQLIMQIERAAERVGESRSMFVGALLTESLEKSGA